jgi:hypothetical protein
MSGELRPQALCALGCAIERHERGVRESVELAHLKPHAPPLKIKGELLRPRALLEPLGDPLERLDGLEGGERGNVTLARGPRGGAWGACEVLLKQGRDEVTVRRKEF